MYQSSTRFRFISTPPFVFYTMAKKFYAQKDFLGFPVPGTLMAASKVPSNTIEITGQDVSQQPASDFVQHPSAIRYFVRKDKKGNILPNSLVIGLQKPKGANVVEFKLPK
jgi:hypothetical protein